MSAKIILLDPSPLLRQGLTFRLEFYGHEVVLSTADTEQLLGYLENTEHPADLLVTEIGTAPLNAYEVTAVIKQKYPAVRVLILSACCTSYSVPNLMVNGISGYLTKLDSAEEFDLAVEMILDGGEYFTDTVKHAMYDAITKQPYIKGNTFKPKELEFLKYCCREMTYKEIAAAMGTTPRILDLYRINIFAKLNLRSREGMIVFAFNNGIIPLDPPRSTASLSPAGPETDPSG